MSTLLSSMPIGLKSSAFPTLNWTFLPGYGSGLVGVGLMRLLAWPIMTSLGSTPMTFSKCEMNGMVLRPGPQPMSTRVLCGPGR